jgi:flagellar export protein FliJ
MAATREPRHTAEPAMAEALDVLLKIAGTRRDAAARALNVAQQRLAQARREIANLDAMERATRPNDETVFAAGTFLCQINRRKRQLLDLLPGIERTLDQAKQEVLEAYSECKRLELLLDRQAKSEAQEAARRDSLVVDEMAQMQFAYRRVRS